MRKSIGLTALVIGIVVFSFALSLDSRSTSPLIYVIIAAGVMCFWTGLFILVLKPVGRALEQSFLLANKLSGELVLLGEPTSNLLLRRYSPKTSYYIALSGKQVRVIETRTTHKVENVNDVTLPLTQIYAIEFIKDFFSTDVSLLFRETAPAWVQNVSLVSLKSIDSTGKKRDTIKAVEEFANNNGVLLHRTQGTNQSKWIALYCIAIILGVIGFLVWYTTNN